MLWMDMRMDDVVAHKLICPPMRSRSVHVPLLVSCQLCCTTGQHAAASASIIICEASAGGTAGGWDMDRNRNRGRETPAKVFPYYNIGQ